MRSARLRRLLLWVALPAALLVLLYAVLGFVVAPRAIRSETENFVAGHYHRRLSLGEVTFNPFTLRLDVQDFSLPDSDGQPMLAFRHLLVDLTVASVWHLGPSFGTILLEQPLVRAVIRKDGTLNLAELALPPAPNAPAAPHPKALRVFLDHLSVRDGNLTFEDRAHQSAFRSEIRPIDFELRNFSTVGGENGTYALRGVSEAGEQLDWSGSLSANPLASRGTFEITNLRASTLWSYIRDSVRFELPSGALSLHGDYAFTAATDPIGLTANVQNVTVTDLGVRPKGGREDYVTIPSIEILDTHADLATRNVAVGRVHLSGADVRAWLQAPGVLNLLELLPAPGTAPAAGTAPVAGTAPTPAATPPTNNWSISVPDIALDALKITAQDRQVTPALALQLDRLNVHVTGFATRRTAPVAITVSGDVNRDGHLDVKGEISSDFSSMKLQTDLSKLDLTVLQPYIARRTALTLRSGLLSARLNVDRSPDRLAVSGEADVAKMHTVDNALKKDFVKVDRLLVSGIEYQSSPARLRIRSIVAQAPYARVIVESDRTVNVERVLRAPGATGATAATSNQEPPAPAARMPIAIDVVRIQGGSAHYTDYWIQPHFGVAIQTLDGSIRGLSSSPRDRAKVELNGKVDRYAPVRIWGEINPLAATTYSDLRMSFKGLELTTITPYSGHFAGYKIDKGKLSVDIAYKIQNRQLTAEHRLVIDQLQLGERVDSPDATKLPLKIAIALLKDRNGVIDINLPVTGSLNDPEFSLAPLLWKAVLGLITKVATAPFALLGRLFGGGEQMNFIDFQPGSATLDQQAHDKLAALAKALKAKPQLDLDVPVTYSADVDRPGLARMHLQNSLLALSQQQAAGGNQHTRKQAAELHDTAPHDTAPHDTARHDTAPHDTAPHDTAPHDTPDAAGDDPALADPMRRFKLLLQLYRTDLGKDAVLPASAQALETATAKKGQVPDAGQADAELESGLLQKMPVSDAELDALGRHRARAIQDVLLGGGEVDPSRVFIIGAKQKVAAEAGKVRVELALK